MSREIKAEIYTKIPDQIKKLITSTLYGMK